MPPKISEYIGFAVPCLCWILALKHFFWGTVSTYLAVYKMPYQILDLKTFFQLLIYNLYFHLCKLFFAHLSIEILMIFIW